MIEIPSQTVFYAIEKAIKEYRRFAQGNISKVVEDITLDQALLLLFLNNNPELSQKEIANLVFKDRASITRMLELMRKNGYLSREINQEDRRKYTLKITEKGQRILQEILPIISFNRVSALRGISNEEIFQLFTILNQITTNCQLK